ncbi:MAG: UDP-N-acetylmuramate dehydrogenase [Butyrivibrio sp.]|nr:UDP-N-acetylmuramate dehydrogenase [Butyrivibrio sp.]
MDFLSEAGKIVGTDILTDEKMDKHTTFKVGGRAKYFAAPTSEEQVRGLIALCKSAGVPYFIVGNGSNLLVSDSGYEGMIILIGQGMSRIKTDGCVITAQAGALLPRLAMAAAAEGLGGLEFAAGIPGSVGGGCVMNAGAYGGELKDVLTRVRALTPDGNIRDFAANELELGYRHSIFSGGGFVVLEAELKLEHKDISEINALMAELAQKRRAKQPLEYPSAGSTFKRPQGFFAGKLIEEAGLKGRGAGGACVSEKHAGFIINKGGATAQDIYDTVRIVINGVKEKHGVTLEPEIRIIGEFL